MNDELNELLAELENSNLLKDSSETNDLLSEEIASSIPLNESEVKSFSFDDIGDIDLESSLTEELSSPLEFEKETAFNEDGLSMELRQKMMFDSTLNEGNERIVDQEGFVDLISEVLEEQEEYIEEVGAFHPIPNEQTVDYLKLRFEEERHKNLLNVQNSVLSIQQEEEEISEYIFCKGLYTEHFKVFIHSSPLIKKGNMPLVIELDGDYILYHRINPEPKVIQHLINTLPNFKFTYINGEEEKEVTPFSFIDKCEFTI